MLVTATSSATNPAIFASSVQKRVSLLDALNASDKKTAADRRSESRIKVTDQVTQPMPNCPTNPMLPPICPTAFDVILANQNGQTVPTATTDSNTLADAKIDAPKSAKDEFMEYAKKTPAERMRDDILKSMGLTEDQLKAMSPEDRAKVEQKIREMIKEKMKEHTGMSGTSENVPAAIAIAS